MFARAKRFLILGALLLITLLFVIFAVANRDSVTFTLFPFPYTAQMPLFLLAVLSFALGMLMASLLLARRIGRAKRAYSDEHLRVLALENEKKLTQTTALQERA